ncbi:hydroxyethylthiazole kinase [Aliiruegeria haliotis]|uniref:Hydroxyethylthiazole kinase n=1 Tax=Aliiruegeria haliotis TaxID=1280846 RepID=A0A2T0RWE9_9RHOB|nr:hydroxyethylthiazole kinase [Aliiruegeria haliotis]PRY25452.1 hydroxyethylthiazole kinase [Aliiruegeria haliotis]
MPTPSESLVAMRDAAPLVQCITNFVAMNFAANALLAAGAAPAMVHDPEESGEFAAVARAVTVNIGTLSPRWLAGMSEAVAVAQKAGTPWVLDPVACFATTLRREGTGKLLQMQPTIVRGNASEIMAIAGEDSSGQGVDAGDPVAAAEAGARKVAEASGSVVAVTGEVDYVTDGTRAVRIAGGSALMPRVTATGCSLTTVCGAYAAVVEPFDATVAALVHFAAAGELAADKAEGPGSFIPAFLDALAAVGPDTLNEDRVSVA